MSFHLLNVFWHTKGFNLIKSNSFMFFFSFVAYTFYVISKIALPNPRSWILTPNFFSKSLKVLVLILRSLIHLSLYFCMWCEVGVQLHSFYVNCQLFWYHSLKRIFFSHWLVLTSLSNVHWPVLASVTQLIGALSSKPKGCGFDSQSGHMPRLWVQSPVWACTRGTDQCFFLTLMLLSPSLSPSLPISLKSISMSQMRFMPNSEA